MSLRCRGCPLRHVEEGGSKCPCIIFQRLGGTLLPADGCTSCRGGILLALKCRRNGVLPHPYGPEPQLLGAAQEIAPLLPQSEGKEAQEQAM